MQEEGKRWPKILISICNFFIIGLILLALWNIFLVEEIKKSGRERDELKKGIEKIKIAEESNRSFTKDVIRLQAISFCFWELIREHRQKYNSEEIQECIQIVALTDEKYGHKGLDAPLILSWLEMESDGNPVAVSYAGAKGLTQLMDFRADEVLTTIGYPGYQEKLVFNPVVNLTGGVYHLNDLMNFWENQDIKNQFLILFYALHSYKWGARNTEQLFNSGRKALRPATEYVNLILNRREYWVKKLEYCMENTLKFTEEMAE